MSRSEPEKTAIDALVRRQRWAALATITKDQQPYASMVAYALEEDFDGLLLLLSRLSAHTQHLLVNPTVSMVISEIDRGEKDPQSLQRISIQGRAVEIPRASVEYDSCRLRYCERLPESERLFQFADFILFRLIPDTARYIGGFGRTRTLSHAQLRSCWRAEPPRRQ